MKIEKGTIQDLFILTPVIHTDSRGYFMESYRKQIFQEAGLPTEWVQENQSQSVYGVIRGLHYQTGAHQQAKLVRVLSGRVLDVVLDIRPESSTYGTWFAKELDDETQEQIYVPRGCAHGFAVLSPVAVFTYKCDNYYNKPSEGGVHPLDPALAIHWMLDPEDQILSDKDQHLPYLGDHKPI